jgi:hypothetical protein
MITILPPVAYGYHPLTGEPIMIKAGARGYWQMKVGIDPDKANKDANVTSEQASALFTRAFGKKADSA